MLVCFHPWVLLKLDDSGLQGFFIDAIIVEIKDKEHKHKQKT